MIVVGRLAAVVHVEAENVALAGNERDALLTSASWPALAPLST
jgi:hypothetical protein